MKIAKAMTTLVALALAVAPLLAADGEAEALKQFQGILEGINNQSFPQTQNAIDKTDMSNRILNARLIEPDARQALNDSFWQIIEAGFRENLPPPGSKIVAKLIDFTFENDKGRAALRFKQPNFEYNYQVFDLRLDNRGRLKIVDWFNTGTGQMFSTEIAENLVILMPTKAATRKQISIANPSDLQLFQVTEIFKASRDNQAARFFEIYDEFNDQLKQEPFIAKYAVFMAFMLKDMDRFAHALDIFEDVFSNDPDFALVMSDFQLIVGAYDKSYASMSRFHDNFPLKEGAIPARLSALALALGKLEEAQKYAVEASEDEPSLELAWWSLLRARARAQDNAGAIEALTYLEDSFGHRLDESKLRRDKYSGFTTLVDTQEFKDWRAGRN